MIGEQITRLQKFIYSHYFVSGFRRSSGVLLAFFIMFVWAGNAESAMIGALGALCVAIIDQPGPLGQRLGTMIGGTVLGALAVTLTGYASANYLLLLLSIVFQTFFFSMLTVFGKRGAVVGTGCLILTVVTMHTPLTEAKVLQHTLITASGALFYLAYSALVSRPMRIREQEQSLAVALISTGNYLAARAQMYEPGANLDEAYRQLFLKQSDTIDQQQACRDMIMAHLSPEALEGKPRRLMVWNVFIDMVNIMGNLAATYTDYASLHRDLGDSDALTFVRDALVKFGNDIDRVAEAVVREKAIKRRNSVKAELLALEYETVLMKQKGFAATHPEAYLICLQVLRRLRRLNTLVDHMVEQTARKPDTKPLNMDQLNASLKLFLSRQSFHPSLLTSNLKMSSPTFRFSVRVTICVAIAMLIGIMFPILGPRGYWIVLTVIIIMKPAFALTKERNTDRLVGTIVGCFLAFGSFMFVHDMQYQLILLALALLVGYSLVIVNYMFSTVFNTMALLLALHLLLPDSYQFVSARAFDTILGSIIAFFGAYILPWWEAKSLPNMATNMRKAMESYLRACLDVMTKTMNKESLGLLKSLTLPLARRDAEVAFSNFAQAFYRMLREPAAHQQNVAEYNNLLLQNHILGAQIASLMSQFNKLPTETQKSIINAITCLDDAFTKDDLEAASLDPLGSDTDPAHLEWLYPLRQMQRAVQSIIRESEMLHIELPPPPQSTLNKDDDGGTPAPTTASSTTTAKAT